MKAALDFCLETLRQRKVDKFQCSLKKTKQYEMNLEGADFSLIRTNAENTLNITVIQDQRKGAIAVNRLDQEGILEAVEQAIELCNTSQQDPDYDISPAQKAKKFTVGPQEPDPERMYELLKEYTQQVPDLFPAIKLMETAFLHKHLHEYFANSNGVEFEIDQGSYNFSSVFSSKEGDKTTSFNYTGFAAKDLQTSLMEKASLNTLLRQSVEHLNAKPYTGKFVGDVIITPDCLGSFLYAYTMTFLGDGALISGTSPFKDKLGKKVANSKLTLSSEPISPAMAEGYFVTHDGFEAENVTLIEDGVLQSFLLSQYGSKKTGLERAKNQGDCFVIEPGDKNLAEMISQVKQGLLVGRYSGGSPSPNGDFSGVAKNSYYIENGKIMCPVTETMIAGNFAAVFDNIKEISAERIDYGNGLIPYLLSTGVTVSGK